MTGIIIMPVHVLNQERSKRLMNINPHFTSSVLRIIMSHQGLLQDGRFIRKKPSLYTSEQILEWLRRLKWSQSFTLDELREGKFPTTLQNLAALVRCHAVTFPYENLEMH
jgi:hypothetical protein